jgi:16S rRNA (cytosine967-C5)-methyltransferase
MKGILAQIVPTILLRPVALAEALGVGVPEYEPWSIEAAKLANWRPAYLMAERLYESMSQGWPRVQAGISDFPNWMTEEWVAAWDTQAVHGLMAELGREPPLSLRATYKIGAKKLLEELKQGVKLPIRAELSGIAPNAVRLAGYTPVMNTELYRNGSFEIQDEGSQFMSLFSLWPKMYGVQLQMTPGRVTGSTQEVHEEEHRLEKGPLNLPLSVIDACAGAGGKSLAISDALRGKGRIYAYDISAKKIQALKRRATRLGLNNIQSFLVAEGAESELTSRFQGQAQVVLVDAPCSGWGVLRRNPDIKWRQDPSVLSRMPEIQFRLLSLYSSLVAEGGHLVYGVCTFRLAETRKIVDRFLNEHSDFRACEGGYLGPGPCDGFFMQSFYREKE